MVRILLLVGLLFGGAAQAQPPTILVFGDSLSAAYGIPLEQGWVQLMAERLAKQGYPHRVVNASVSGETSAGGLARLPDALARHTPGMVLIELGANDGLRGLPVKAMKRNLGEMVAQVQAANARAVLFEMRIPPNYGAAYTHQFFDAFGEVAKRSGATLVPFWLEKIALYPSMFQDDAIHPNASAQPLLLDAVWPTVKALLDGTAPASKAAADRK